MRLRTIGGNLKGRTRNGLCWILALLFIANGSFKKGKHESFREGVITPICFHNPSRKLFRAVVVWLKENGYKFISSSQLKEILHGRMTCPNGAVWISFDDGWKRNIDNVIPTVIEYYVPITVFVATDSIEAGTFWWRVARQLAGYLPKGMSISRTIRELPRDLREEILDMLRLRASEQTTMREVMSIGEIIHLSEIPQVTIGSHSVMHMCFPDCTGEEIDYELRESKNKLESWIGKPITSFAFPELQIDMRARQALQKYGYELAASAESKHARSNCDPYQVPRIRIEDDGSLYENLCRVLGVWQPRIRKLSRVFKLWENLNKVSSRQNGSRNEVIGDRHQLQTRADDTYIEDNSS